MGSNKFLTITDKTLEESRLILSSSIKQLAVSLQNTAFASARKRG